MLRCTQIVGCPSLLSTVPLRTVLVAKKPAPFQDVIESMGCGLAVSPNCHLELVGAAQHFTRQEQGEVREEDKTARIFNASGLLREVLLTRVE